MARIGIFCSAVFHVIHFKEVYRELIAESYEVLFVECSNDEKKKELELYLEKESVNYVSSNDIFLKQIKLDLFLAPYFTSFFNLIDVQNKLLS